MAFENSNPWYLVESERRMEDHKLDPLPHYDC